MAIFDKYNLEVISSVVTSFYNRILASENLAGYFVGVNMNRLREHQTEFISHIMGGPVVYTGRQLASAHKSLNVKESDFIEMSHILEQTLLDNGVEPKDVEVIMNLVVSQKDKIVA
jgi:hemoglobin